MAVSRCTMFGVWAFLVMALIYAPASYAISLVPGTYATFVDKKILEAGNPNALCSFLRNSIDYANGDRALVRDKGKSVFLRLCVWHES